MRTLLAQIERSLDSDQYYLSLMGALIVPDIGGALDSADGEASGKKYVEWYETWVRPRFVEKVLTQTPPEVHDSVRKMENPFDGAACYKFRCSLLHQGSTQHSKSAYTRVMFIEPGATTNVVHYGRLNDALCIDLNLFCREVIDGARIWLDEVEKQPDYVRNYERFVKRHPGGLPPYIGGVPVIS